MLLAGLTGNYGMGKSTVLHIFAKLGAVTRDSDEIVRTALEEEDVLKRIRRLLGGGVFYKNGRLNKKKAARVIFENDALRQSLEDIIHPLVFEKVHSLAEGLKGTGKIVVIEVPLLFEREYENRFDRTITVYTEEKVALYRLKKQGIRRKEAMARLKSQLPIKEKMQRADFVIDNNGTFQETADQVRSIYEKLSGGRNWRS
jgi:dephospho-CoA kinase